MNRNAQPRPAPAADPADETRGPAPARRILLAALLLLLVAGVAGGVWLLNRGDPGDGPGGSSGDPPGGQAQRPACSDDDDPKYLDPLEYGSPVEVRFDRRFLDALAERPIPPLEVYPWQPEGLVAVLGEHRMRGDLFALSPDGKTAAVAAAGDTYLRFGGLDTLHEKHLLVVPGGAHVLAWSPGGETLAVRCGDGEVRLFDVRDKALVPTPVTLEKSAAPVTSLSWSGDGKYLLGGDSTPKRGSAWLWDARTRKLVRQLKHVGPVMGVALSPVPGDHRALTGGGTDDAQVHLWDAPAGKELAVIDFGSDKKEATAAVGPVAFSPDGKRALSSHPDGVVRLWDLDRFAKGRELHALAGHAGTAPDAAFAPDGRSVATTGLAAGGVGLWDARSGKQVRRLAVPVRVHALQFVPAGDRLVSAGTVSNDRNVRVHEVGTGEELVPPAGHLAALTCVTLMPAGRVVVSGGSDLNVRVWDLDGLKQRHAVGVGHVWGVGPHPDGKRAFFYGAFSGTLSLVDVESGQPRTPAWRTAGVSRPVQHGGAISSAALTRDGRYAVTAGASDGTVCMWRLEDGRQVRVFRGLDGQGAVTVAPDMRRAIRTGGAKTRLLHLRCQEVKHEWAPAAWAPFLPDGRAAFFGGKRAPLWEITGDRVKESGEIDLDLTGLGPGHLSADGNRAAAVVGGRVAVFEMDPARQVWAWAPPPHFYGVKGVALSPDGGHLLTANGDGTVYVIRLPRGDRP